MTPEEQINLNLETANRFRSDALVMSEANVKWVVGRLQAQIKMKDEALKSIAANTCCDNCQEAALVARKALSKGEE